MRMGMVVMGLAAAGWMAGAGWGQETPAKEGAVAAGAVKSECDNWRQAHPNWIFCDDFETGDWSRWGHGPTSGERLLVSPEKAFLGKYAMKFAFGDLPTPGYQYLIFQRKDLEEIRMRWYIYLDRYWHWGFQGSDHCLALWASGAKTVTNMAAGLDLGPWGPVIMRFGLGCNMGKMEDRVMHNGRWYRLELHLKMNTIGACVDKNKNGKFDDRGESDGVFELWIDDTQVMGYYDLNYRGNDNPDYRISEMMFNHFFRTGGQTYFGKPMTEYRDNLVLLAGDNGGKRIGPAPGEPKDLGTPDMYSPYKTEIYHEWFAFDKNGVRVKAGSDGGPAGNLWSHCSSPYELVSKPAHNGTATPYAKGIPEGNDKALAAKTVQGRDFSGSGTDGVNNLPGKGQGAVINGWMYLDPAGFPAEKGAALSGMTWSGKYSLNYLGMGVDGRNHPTLLRQVHAYERGFPEVLDTNKEVTIEPGKWYRFEVRGSKDHTWSVLLDGKEVVKARKVDDEDLWSRAWTYHYGISDHLDNAKPLVVYYDDISIGSTSFEDGWGWNPEIQKPEAGSPKAQ
jgi:hypothetical protein